MAVKKTETDEKLKTTEVSGTEKTDQTDTIENWAAKKKVNSAVLVGVKALKNWCTGKSVTEPEFDRAVELFLLGPADGRK